MPHPRDIFAKEFEELKKIQNLIENKNLGEDEDLWDRYVNLSEQYERLLNDSAVITSISDRLQNRLEKTNQKLQEQSEEIKTINNELEARNQLLEQTISELTKTKISKKATTIVLIAAVVLFIVSEGVLEPFIEMHTESFILGFLAKGTIALLLRPIDYLVERYLMARAMRKSGTLIKTYP